MFFSRTENFRHAFGKPPEIRMKLKQDPQNTIYGLLLDISPSGARVFLDNEIPTGAGRLNLSFVIVHERISADAAIIWVQQASGGWVYGLQLMPNAVQEMFIADEVTALKQKK